MRSINPATNTLLKTYQTLSNEAVSQRIEETHHAFMRWRFVAFEQRSDIMRKLASLLRAKKKLYAKMIIQEMGKVAQEAVAEIEKCAWACDYYADHAAAFLQNETIETDARQSFVTYQPLGIVLAVMPWNFPFWQVFRFAAPALMAGNAALLKHASNVSGTALMIEELFLEAGFPESLFSTLLITSDQVNHVIEHPKVRAITLTGSTKAGRAVAAKAGEMLKKTVLELGGSDAYLILEDADIAAAATRCAKSRMLNAGQSCIAAKRFIVVEAVYDAFLDALKTEMQHYHCGNPENDNTNLGPQATTELRDALHKQVRASIEKGANCVLGGVIPEEKGAYYPPTILTHVTVGMPAYEEELFGPVASVIKVKDETEAITVANDSSYGLGSAVFTGNEARGVAIATQHIEAGACFVNDFVKSDPRLPFGGVKDSGYGRELSHFGIKEFVNSKTVSVK